MTVTDHSCLTQTELQGDSSNIFEWWLDGKEILLYTVNYKDLYRLQRANLALKHKVWFMSLLELFEYNQGHVGAHLQL